MGGVTHTGCVYGEKKSHSNTRGEEKRSLFSTHQSHMYIHIHQNFHFSLQIKGSTAASLRMFQHIAVLIILFGQPVPQPKA